jgi:hypothetical protein
MNFQAEARLSAPAKKGATSTAGVPVLSEQAESITRWQEVCELFCFFWR